MIDDIKWSLMKEEDTHPNRMKIHWKTRVTCVDKDDCQSKRLLPKLKELHNLRKKHVINILEVVR